MTKTKQALMWIAQRKPRKEMAKDLGITPEECHRLMGYLRASGYVLPEPEFYELTPKGHAKRIHKPKTPPAVIARKVVQRRERKAQAEKVSPAAGIVARAIKANEGSALFNFGRSQQ